MIIKPVANGTMIDGSAATEHLDSSGERLSIEGLDISSLEAGDGVFNWEHKSDHVSNIVGRILFAKKIFKEEDCANERELYWWNKIKAPFLYVIGELFDGTGHAAAKDLAAMIKYDHLARQKGIPVKNVVNFSIEGSKLETEKNGEIPKAIARKVTCTVAACNKMATAELYIPPKEKPIAKKEVKAFSDIFKSESDRLAKSEENQKEYKMLRKDDQSGIDRAWKPSISRLAGKNIVSLNHPQHGSITIVKYGDQFFVKHNGTTAGLRSNPGVFDNAKDALEHAQKYAQAVSSGMVSPKKIHNMPSMQSAGLQRPVGKLASKGPMTPPMPMPKIKKSAAAPSQLVNQDALQRENLVSSIKKRANQAYKTFEKAEELLEHLKKKHPNISEPVLKALVKMFALKREQKLEKALEEIAKK
jgi:hypothetical protein